MVSYPAPNHRWASKVIVQFFLGLIVRAASKIDIPEMTTELPVNDMVIERKKMQQLSLSWGLYMSQGRLLHALCRLMVTSQVLGTEL